MRISDWSSDVCSSDLHLLPPSGSEERVQALSFLTLLASSVHIAFRPVLRPDRLATTMHAQADVRSTGVQMLDSVLGRLEREIAGEASVLESGFSLCDAYAIVFAQWSRRPQVRRSEERRVGKECVSTVRSWWCADH